MNSVETVVSTEFIRDSEIHKYKKNIKKCLSGQSAVLSDCEECVGPIAHTCNSSGTVFVERTSWSKPVT